MTLAWSARVEVAPEAILRDRRTHDLAHRLADALRQARTREARPKR